MAKKEMEMNKSQYYYYLKQDFSRMHQNRTAHYFDLAIEYWKRVEGVSINGLAKRSNLPPSTLKNILNGETQAPTFTTLDKIAKGLDVTMDDLCW